MVGLNLRVWDLFDPDSHQMIFYNLTIGTTTGDQKSWNALEIDHLQDHEHHHLFLNYSPTPKPNESKP